MAKKAAPRRVRVLAKGEKVEPRVRRILAPRLRERDVPRQVREKLEKTGGEYSMAIFEDGAYIKFPGVVRKARPEEAARFARRLAEQESSIKEVIDAPVGKRDVLGDLVRLNRKFTRRMLEEFGR